MLFSGVSNSAENVNPWSRTLSNAPAKKEPRPWGNINPAPTQNQNQKQKQAQRYVYPGYYNDYARQPARPYMYPGYGQGYNPGMPGFNTWPGAGILNPFFGQ